VSFKGSMRVPRFLGKLISCFSVLMRHCVIFRSEINMPHPDSKQTS